MLLKSIDMFLSVVVCSKIIQLSISYTCQGDIFVGSKLSCLVNFQLLKLNQRFVALWSEAVSCLTFAQLTAHIIMPRILVFSYRIPGRMWMQASRSSSWHCLMNVVRKLVRQRVATDMYAWCLHGCTWINSSTYNAFNEPCTQVHAACPAALVVFSPVATALLLISWWSNR